MGLQSGLGGGLAVQPMSGAVRGASREAFDKMANIEVVLAVVNSLVRATKDHVPVLVFVTLSPLGRRRGNWGCSG